MGWELYLVEIWLWINGNKYMCASRKYLEHILIFLSDDLMRLIVPILRTSIADHWSIVKVSFG